MSKQPIYDHSAIERQVQQRWRDEATFEVTENSDQPKFYCLSMFPYPSGQLHMGHVRTYTLGDVISRYQRLLGKNVLHPMGWDAFGLPAENAAIERDIPPAAWTRGNIKSMKSQMQALGFAYDWSREFATCDPEYYRWEQWFFTRMFRKSLVYKKSAWVNWDPVDQTVLANEQVVNGRGWRSDALVERREWPQWFVRITAYAEELLACLDQLPGWPEKIKTLQRNWIGKSSGLELTFPLINDPAGPAQDAVAGLSVYTTRPDTLMGATYLAVAPQHILTTQAAERDPAIKAFVAECHRVKGTEAEIAKLPKQGMDTGFRVTHPITGAALPVWVANFVLMEYGAGAVMSVPGHDQRDWEFARQYQLPIKQVIAPHLDSDDVCDLDQAAFTSHGLLVNSGEFNGMDFDAAFEAIATSLARKNLGERQINYRLRDWGVGRQRYWGCPIPIILCDQCGAVPVPDKDLPVLLPTEVRFEGVGSPLKKMSDWYKTRCPECDGAAVRETDTFDTFMESSWYYARFTCSNSSDKMLDERVRDWGPVNHYVGGEEHAILHLLYARFFHKVMRDEGLVESDEPFEKLLALGMVLKDGKKMSKSAGDAGDPQVLMERFGADAVRMAMMFAAPPEQPFEWSEHSVEAAHKWLRTRLWFPVVEFAGDAAEACVGAGPIDKTRLTDGERQLHRLTHETLARCGDDYARRLTFNTVIASVMTLMNQVIKFDAVQSQQGQLIKQEALRAAVLIMSPVTPHICHSLWARLTGESIEAAGWPVVDEAAREKDSFELIVQVNGKLRGRLEVQPDAAKDDVIALARGQGNVEKFVAGKAIRKVIYVPNKILNFVVA